MLKIINGKWTYDKKQFSELDILDKFIFSLLIEERKELVKNRMKRYNYEFR